MTWRCLNDFSSTGFLRPNAFGPGRDLLLDMQGRENALAPSLAHFGSSLQQIAVLFLTHHHPDHLFIHDALALAQQGTLVYLGRQTWQEAQESYVRLKEPASAAAAKALEATGQLRLLPPAGSLTLATTGKPSQVLWRAFPHGDGDRSCENLAFAFDDHVFTGDTSVAALFDPHHGSAVHAAALLGQAGARQDPPCRVLYIDIARLSRAEIAADTSLNDRRRRNYYDNHGILEAFLAALKEPRWHDFFAGLQVLAPIHLRRQPLTETARTIREQILTTARAQGFGFAVSIAGLP